MPESGSITTFTKTNSGFDPMPDQIDYVVLEPEELNRAVVLGIDLGGTRLRAVLADKAGKFLCRAEIFTQAHKGKDYVISNIELLIESALKIAHNAKIEVIVIGAPGPLNPYTGVIYLAPNLPGWVNVPLCQILQAKFNIPVFLGNDANLGALGELVFGAGKSVEHLVYLTISTGIGGGVVSDGKMILGASGLATEFGHMTIDFRGPRCNCGNLGCWEVLASGTALGRRATELIATGRATAMTEIAKNGEPITAEIVALAAARGDEAAIELLHQTGVYLGVGITNILHLFNPQLIVLGGGVTQIGAAIFEPMWATIRERSMPAYLTDLQIVVTELGGDICLYGTIAMGIEKSATRN